MLGQERGKETHALPNLADKFVAGFPALWASWLCSPLAFRSTLD